MIRSVLCLLCLLPLLACSAIAGTFWVGPCHAGSFASLSDAVKSPTVAAGSTVYVCPGVTTYMGQVIISKPLTIQGVKATNAKGITSTGGYFQYGETFGTSTSSVVLGTSLLPMFWITASPVNLADLTIDMDQSQLSPPACGTLNVAIYYASGSSGTVNHVVALNSEEGTYSSGCGVGIWAENATLEDLSVTVENSVIESNNYGVVAASLQPKNTIPVMGVTLTGNQISADLEGIYLFQTRGTISGNVLMGPINAGGTGVFDEAPSTIVTKNTINILGGTGVFVVAPYDNVTNNKIWAELSGIDLGCNVATVTGNSIFANTGLNRVPVSFTGTNYFYNTTFNTQGGC